MFRSLINISYTKPHIGPKRVWFDINMDDKSEDAMKEGVENSSSFKFP